MNVCGTWLVGVATLLAVVGPAFADPPTVSFLTPSKHVAALAETLSLRFAAGAAKDARPVGWPSDEIEWLFVRGGGTQENRDRVRPQNPKDDFVLLRIEHPGVTLVGADRRPIVREMTGDELGTFLRQSVALAEKASIPAGDGELRVRHVASAKTLIRAATAGRESPPSAIATSKTGQKVEIRPLFDPSAARVGSDLPLWSYIDGSKKTGVKVQATNVATGKTTTFLTDAGGSGHFRVTDAGLWRVEFHHAEPLKDGSKADWVVYSATLTFEVATRGADR